jgi:hypothetical protein
MAILPSLFQQEIITAVFLKISHCGSSKKTIVVLDITSWSMYLEIAAALPIKEYPDSFSEMSAKRLVSPFERTRRSGISGSSLNPA